MIIQFDPDEFFTALDLIAKIAENDGHGSGLDADLLDGQHASYFTPLSSYTPADVLAKLLTVDGPGSGLNADLLDGQEGSYYLPASTYIPSDILTKLKTVDGPGSGLDADTLDGIQYSAISSAIAAKLDSVNYNASDVLAKLLTVDGPGSGLNADLLDGVQLSKFLAEGSKIPAEADLNNYTTTGLYIQVASSQAMTGSNYPAAVAGVLEVIESISHNQVYQKYTTRGDTNVQVYVRGYFSGTWYTWYRLLNSTDLTTLNSAIALKLDSATYTPNDVLTKLKTVDGAGSGLDADLLDGANPTATGGTANAIVKARPSGTISPDFLPGFEDETGTFRIPKLIDRRVISSGSPVTYVNFSGLNGNNDEEYILKFKVYKNGTGDVSFILQFNGDTGYNYSSQVKGYVDNSGSPIEDDLNLSEQVLKVGQTRFRSVNWVDGKAEIRAKAGSPRFVKAKSTFYAQQSHSGFDISSGFWNDTSNNISSLKFLNTGGNSFYGTVELLKLVDLVIA